MLVVEELCQERAPTTLPNSPTIDVKPSFDQRAGRPRHGRLLSGVCGALVYLEERRKLVKRPVCEA